MKSFLIVIACLFGLGTSSTVQAQTADASDISADTSRYSKQLSSIDPVLRREGAEALARLAAVDQRKLVEGYALEEKDKRVRLALSWALYRMGKSDALFAVVRDLDSGRHDQAAGYLGQLESPEPLYLFLRQDSTTMKVKGRLIEVLGQVGNNDTLAELKPFLDSFDPKVAEAAKASTKQIEDRLSQSPPDTNTRPRTIAKPDQPR
jgi:HEAT repeat protein